MQTTGGAIRAKRKAHKLSLKDVERHTGYSFTYLSDIELNKKRPSIDVLTALADLFECTLDELIGRDSPMFELTEKEKQIIEDLRKDPTKMALFDKANQVLQDDFVKILRVVIETQQALHNDKT